MSANTQGAASGRDDVDDKPRGEVQQLMVHSEFATGGTVSSTQAVNSVRFLTGKYVEGKECTGNRASNDEMVPEGRHIGVRGVTADGHFVIHAVGQHAERAKFCLHGAAATVEEGAVTKEMWNRDVH